MTKMPLQMVGKDELSIDVFELTGCLSMSMSVSIYRNIGRQRMDEYIDRYRW